MSVILYPLVMLLTVSGSVVLGVIASYGVVTGILFALAPRRRERIFSAPALIPSQTHASGD